MGIVKFYAEKEATIEFLKVWMAPEIYIKDLLKDKVKYNPYCFKKIYIQAFKEKIEDVKKMSKEGEQDLAIKHLEGKIKELEEREYIFNLNNSKKQYF